MPFDRRKYPKDWNAIRARILERAGNKCEWCGVLNGHFRVTWKDGSEKVYRSADSLIDHEGDMIDGEAKVAKIVLTTAHIHNPDPMDCRDENLAALCQRCHNRHDAPMRAANARANRLASLGQGALL